MRLRNWRIIFEGWWRVAGPEVQCHKWLMALRLGLGISNVISAVISNGDCSMPSGTAHRGNVLFQCRSSCIRSCYLDHYFWMPLQRAHHCRVSESPSCWLAAGLIASAPASWRPTTWRRSSSWSLTTFQVCCGHQSHPRVLL